MSEVIILVGISGSGKTTWAANFLQEYTQFVRVNRDDIRKALAYSLEGYYKRKNVGTLEGLVTAMEGVVIARCRLLNINTVIDNTNLKKEYIQQYLDDEGYDVKFKLFDTQRHECERRVMERDGLFEAGYVHRQAAQYAIMKKWILENHKEKVLTE